MSRIVLFHGTNNEFDRFDEKHINSRNDTHSNSALGFWFFKNKNFASYAGKFILKVEVDIKNPYQISIFDLAKISQINLNSEYYTYMREKLINEGYDSIEIIEKDGDCSIVVVLKSDIIHISEKIAVNAETAQNMC